MMDPESEVVETTIDEPLATETAEVTEKPAEPVEPTNKEVKPAPKTMEDTLRERYREIVKDPSAKPKEVPPVEKTEVKPEVKPGEPARGPDGKFLPKDGAAKDPVAPVEQKPTEPAPAVVDPQVAKAPTSWKGEAQAKWDALPAEIKAEVHRREADFHKGIQQYKQESDLFKVLDAEIRPYEAMIRAAGQNVPNMLRSFLNTAYQLRTGTPDAKVATWLQIGQEYGVDIGLLPEVQQKLESGQPVVPPEYQHLQTELSKLQQTIAQRDEATRRERESVELAERDAIQRETAAWAVGKEHYEQVKLDMAALLESGRAKDLDDAYNKAIWAHPEARAKLIAQQQDAERKLAAEKAAAARKAASTNVQPRGTPPARPATKVGTMEDTIREALKKLRSAG